MRIYEVISTFKAYAPIDIDALRAVPGQMDTRMIDRRCPGTAAPNCALVQLVFANGAASDMKGARARVYPNGTVVVTARNAELVDDAAERFASLLGTGPLRCDNNAPRVVKATAKVANAAAIFASLRSSPLWGGSDVLCMRTVDTAKIRMDTRVYGSRAVVMTSWRSGEAPLSSEELAAVFNDALKTIA